MWDAAGVDRDAVSRLAKSGDVRRLMQLLEESGGGVRQAAQAAAGGDPGQLMAMLGRLMDSTEGAELVERIEEQARRAGLQ